MSAHAKYRAPSAAKRWLACPHSALVAAMYPNEDSDASIKGTIWHEGMESILTFGCLPKDVDPDMGEALETLNDYVLRRIEEMGGRSVVKVYIEVQLFIPEIGDVGTPDIVLVGPSEVEIIDLKSGYVAVDVYKNDQMMIYLLGVLAKVGPPDSFKVMRVTIYQPLYDHIDGPLRTYEVTPADLDLLRSDIAISVANEMTITAGPHCKDTYCPHRGACAQFHDYVGVNIGDGWHTSEYKTVTDERLAKALDDAELLAGWRKELRNEAMRRILNHNRTISGYKMVKARKSRTITHPDKLIQNVAANMGMEYAVKMFPDLQWAKAAVMERIALNDFKDIIGSIGSAKQFEDMVKAYARTHNLPRGAWKNIYDSLAGAYIRETHNGLSLEKAIDGRPTHKRGSEFGTIENPADSNKVEQTY